MGTTLVLGLFTNDRLLAGHIGDSRMYRLRGEDFSQITEDHSLVQEEIKYGLITPEEARTSLHKNLVTRALGIDPTLRPLDALKAWMEKRKTLKPQKPNEVRDAAFMENSFTGKKVDMGTLPAPY